MGISNRIFGSPTYNDQAVQRPPMSIVTKIIFVTIGVYLLQMLSHRAAVPTSSLAFDWLALERDLLFKSGQVWRLLTYAFCHSETQLTHIVCNMLALFFLGRIVSRTLGEREFLAVYLTSAVFAGIVQASSMAIWRSPGQDWTLGASGAVSAVFVLFAMHYPKMKLYVFGIVPVQARWLLLIAVAYDTLGFLGMAPNLFAASGVKIGHAAHLGGLIFGFLYFQWHMNLTGWLGKVVGQAREVQLPRTDLRVFNPGVQPEVDYSAQVDQILAKISESGEGSLTDRERRVLTQASQHLKSSR
jgi:membrane associated rhomboid family serine protease